MTTPLTFKPVYKDYLWGGDSLATCYQRPGTPHPCAESWEISGLSEGASIVSNGQHAGRSLPELVSEFGVALLGTKAPDPRRFPLLFKLIDARDRLSIQVHPNNANAACTRGEPKTEMWYVLNRAPNAMIYAGLRKGTTPGALRTALATGTAGDCLNHAPVKPGDAIFIPGGLVHAIGEGCLIYEVQQSSNTTYRLYDWDRKGPDGQPRPLHIEESFKTIDWDLTSSPKASPETGPLVACDYFHVRKLAVAGSHTIPQDGTTFAALFVEDGRATVEAGGETVPLASGTSCLIPAAVPSFTLTGKASFIITTL